jgi:ATP-dependent RNA helicase DDX24/MAK5
VSIVGGISKDKQRRTLAYVPDILVATPGRLWDMIENCEHECLDKLHLIDYLVLDEADRMVELGHFKELDNIIEKVYNKGEVTKNKGDVKKINELISGKNT